MTLHIAEISTFTFPLRSTSESHSLLQTQALASMRYLPTLNRDTQSDRHRSGSKYAHDSENDEARLCSRRKTCLSGKLVSVDPFPPSLMSALVSRNTLQIFDFWCSAVNKISVPSMIVISGPEITLSRYPQSPLLLPTPLVHFSHAKRTQHAILCVSQIVMSQRYQLELG